MRLTQRRARRWRCCWSARAAVGSLTRLRWTQPPAATRCPRWPTTCCTGAGEGGGLCMGLGFGWLACRCRHFGWIGVCMLEQAMHSMGYDDDRVRGVSLYLWPCGGPWGPRLWPTYHARSYAHSANGQVGWPGRFLVQCACHCLCTRSKMARSAGPWPGRFGLTTLFVLTADVPRVCACLCAPCSKIARWAVFFSLHSTSSVPH